MLTKLCLFHNSDFLSFLSYVISFTSFQVFCLRSISMKPPAEMVKDGLNTDVDKLHQTETSLR